MFQGMEKQVVMIRGREKLRYTWLFLIHSV